MGIDGNISKVFTFAYFDIHTIKDFYKKNYGQTHKMDYMLFVSVLKVFLIKKLYPGNNDFKRQVKMCSYMDPNSLEGPNLLGFMGYPHRHSLRS